MAEVASLLGTDHQRVGLDLSSAETFQIILDIGMIMMGMTRAAQVFARAGFEPVNPRQIISLNEVGIQPEAVDHETAGIPIDSGLKVFEVLHHRVADIEAHRIVIAGIKQHALLAPILPMLEPPHHGGAAIDVRPAARVGYRNPVSAADRGK